MGHNSISNAFAELIGHLAKDNSRIARAFITHNHDEGYIQYVMFQNIEVSGINYLQVSKLKLGYKPFYINFNLITIMKLFKNFFKINMFRRLGMRNIYI